MKFIKKYWKLVVVLLFSTVVLYWGIAIIKCEHMTYMYGAQFDDIYVDYTMFQTPDYHKVINYSDTFAEVYYVSRGSGGDLVYYQRETPNSAWEFSKWVTVWSSSGSADDFVWPYVR